MTKKGGNSWNVLTEVEAIAYAAGIFTAGLIVGLVIGFYL